MKFAEQLRKYRLFVAGSWGRLLTRSQGALTLHGAHLLVKKVFC